MMPAEVSQLDMVFPARGEELTPPREEIPAEFFDDGNDWHQLAHLMFLGKALNLTLLPADGIDSLKAWRHLQVVKDTYATKFQHKIAGMACLMSQWFIFASYTYRDVTHTIGEGQ